MTSISEKLTKILTMLENITSMLHLQQIQAQLIKLGLDRNSSAVDRLIVFSSINNINYSCSILTRIENPTAFMWNMIIKGYSNSMQPQNSLTWYSKMINSGTLPDKFTFPFALKACSRLYDLRKGRQIHSQIIKFGPVADSHIDSSLLYLYSTCGNLESARIVFQGIHHRSVVTWNAMISGCVRHELFLKEALDYFHQMRMLCCDGVDEFSLVSVASACSNLGALVLGKWVHEIAYKSGYCEVVPLGNALIDMYGKCGSLEDTYKLFDEMGVRNVVTWSTMIDAFGTHGRGRLAIDMFEEMEKFSIKPDEMVFTSLLCACSHSGLVQEGKLWFERMRLKYGIKPMIQHCGCMIDLLGKAGQLGEAYDLIRAMPIEADAATWRSMVSACLYHGDLDLGEFAANRLITLGLHDSGDVAILSNLYSRLGRSADVERLRRRATKKPGHSFIEVDNVVHEFVSRDTSHPHSEEVYLLINQMVRHFTYSMIYI